MMTKDKALQMAINALTNCSNFEKAIKACKEALEQPAQGIELEWYVKGWDDAKRDWQGLTDDEIGDIYCNTPAQPISNGDIDLMFDFARAIEQALKEKNT